MTNSKTVVLAVVLSLALAALAVIVGAVVLGAGGHVVPGELWTIAGTAVGAIAGLLAKTSTEPDPNVLHGTPVYATLEHTDPGAASAAGQAHVTEYGDVPMGSAARGGTAAQHDATWTADTREAFIPYAGARNLALAVDGSVVRAPKQPAKVAHARATRTAPPASS